MRHITKWVDVEITIDLSDFTDEDLEEELLDRKGTLYGESNHLNRYSAQFLLDLIEKNVDVKAIGFRLSDLIEYLKDKKYESV